MDYVTRWCSRDAVSFASSGRVDIGLGSSRTNEPVDRGQPEPEPDARCAVTELYVGLETRRQILRSGAFPMYLIALRMRFEINHAASASSSSAALCRNSQPTPDPWESRLV
jgi:hypothetical protein